MKPSAAPDLNNVFSLLQWLGSQRWLWAVVGVIVLLVIVVWLLPDAKVKPYEVLSSSDLAANEIALGFLQNGRRRREPWVALLAVRGALGARLGRAPKAKEWVAAVVEAGGGKREAAAFAKAVESLEQQARKAAKGTIPADDYVTTLDGYAYGQAVALTTWGVALGHGTVDEARQIIHHVNDAARPSFRSWSDFGLGYVVGRVMHWSDGRPDEESFDKWGDSAMQVAAALTEKRGGPWSALPWSR